MDHDDDDDSVGYFQEVQGSHRENPDRAPKRMAKDPNQSIIGSLID